MLDAVVVGGGPAGAAAAAELARRGLTVALLERDGGAGNRLCGEFLSPDGVASARALGVVPELTAAGAPRVLRWRIESASSAIGAELPAAGLGVARRILDPLLRRRAAALGAVVHEGERVAAVERAPAGWRVLTAGGRDLSTSRLVVAVGRGARIPGVPGRAASGAEPGFVALKAHFGGEADAETVQLFPLGDAYAGIAPVGPCEFNVCFLARRFAFRRAGKSGDDLLRESTKRSAAFARALLRLERTGPWTAASSMSWAEARTERDGILFAGDAAAEIAPFLGEGLALALESGRLAAAHVDAPPGAYSRAWSRRFEGRLRAGCVLQRVLLSRRGADLAVRALAVWPGLAERIVLATRSRELLAAP